MREEAWNNQSLTACGQMQARGPWFWFLFLWIAMHPLNLPAPVHRHLQWAKFASSALHVPYMEIARRRNGRPQTFSLSGSCRRPRQLGSAAWLQDWHSHEYCKHCVACSEESLIEEWVNVLLRGSKQVSIVNVTYSYLVVIISRATWQCCLSAGLT